MILEHSNYRNYLKGELADRVLRNPSYSLRAFARHIEISPAFLSLILSGKKKLAPDTALKVADRLGLSSTETEYFGLLVQHEINKDEDVRMKLLERMHEINSKKMRKDFSVEIFRIVSDWYHFAILMLTEIQDFKFNPVNVSDKLGINRAEADAAIQRLMELELLNYVDGKYRRVKGDLIAQSNVPNTAFQKHYKQILEKAIQSLGSPGSHENLIGAETIAINKSQLKEAEQIMDDFFGKMIALSKKRVPKTEVYNVGVQIFNLTSRGEK